MTSELPVSQVLAKHQEAANTTEGNATASAGALYAPIKTYKYIYS